MHNWEKRAKMEKTVDRKLRTWDLVSDAITGLRKISPAVCRTTRKEALFRKNGKIWARRNFRNKIRMENVYLRGSNYLHLHYFQRPYLHWLSHEPTLRRKRERETIVRTQRFYDKVLDFTYCA